MSSIVPPKSCSMGFLVPYGAISLFLQRHNRRSADGPSVGVFGVRGADGAIEERMYVPLRGSPSPLSMPGRWAGHKVSVVCNEDNPDIYDRACRKYHNITLAFVEEWNFHFPKNGLEFKVPT